MRCTRCDIHMQRRDGKYGVFYFCVSQHTCGQPTVSERFLKNKANAEFRARNYKSRRSSGSSFCGDDGYDHNGDAMHYGAFE